MGIEIERKFLVVGDGWRAGAVGRRFRQGYLSLDPDRTVRVRLDEDRGYLTVKGRAVGLVRAEFEVPVPAADAAAMLDGLCHRPLIEKTRYRVPFGGRIWEVDEFAGVNRGLVLAEVELDAAEDAVALPPWVGAEVSGEPRYQNANLVAEPYTRWPGRR